MLGWIRPEARTAPKRDEREKEEPVELTATQVGLIAALIALAAPAITYRANARLDRDRWVRQRRAETYIEALAVLGRIAAHVTGPASRPDPFEAVGGDPDAEVRRKEADGHRAEIRERYADLISRVREELRQDRDPWWRRLTVRRTAA
jgi:hypothetical protein